MDLKSYKEARQALEDDIIKACLGQFSLEELYEYFFSYGNTLGELEDIDGMNNVFSRALKISSEELSDLSRCELTWTNLMLFAERAQAWEYLEGESRNAQFFAKKVVNDLLMFKAKWHHIVALKGLNRIEEARKEADILLKALHKIGADDAATRLQKLIDSL